ncbi:hypothetical protein SPBR_00473 [Sporothrix brasiliensis 5110]|uniref:Adenylyl-sulfate kinase n=1 Tax=Sporothrix brasiliensis 5110 TaxID=1398154 RepID=A0A0C2IUH8_9PEZI|nr:uncharacterized protein SPBR_00473 [Sporothrix brasiliensis 5110]KIH90425.1 hypothetical protein SPBR_00473 [Sporothrix brasiliensis 5110]
MRLSSITLLALATAVVAQESSSTTTKTKTRDASTKTGKNSKGTTTAAANNATDPVAGGSDSGKGNSTAISTAPGGGKKTATTSQASATSFASGTGTVSVNGGDGLIYFIFAVVVFILALTTIYTRPTPAIDSDVLGNTPQSPATMATTRNITWHTGLTRQERNQARGQKGYTIWFTGLSASGKSTVATALEQHLLHLGVAAYRLDGDNVRFGLNKDLGFSEKDRNENIRRIAEVAKLFADSSTVAITSFISPYRADRQLARELHTQSAQAGNAPLEFIEVYVDIPIDVAEQRDPKGLYKKARAGEIKEFTGISAPYEAPLEAEITIKTHENTVEECVAQIVEYLKSKSLLFIPTASV